MKVEWSKRAEREHQKRERMGRVKARLQGQIVGDIKLGVPVITDHQLNVLNELATRFENIREQLDSTMGILKATLDCFRPEGHPSGWASIEVVERGSNVLVANIRHHKSAGATKPGRDDVQQKFNRVKIAAAAQARRTR